MAFQAYESNLGARQHSRIGGTMRLVTCLTAFKTYSSMLEGERSPLVSVAFKATRFVGGEGLKHRGANAAMRVMTVYTIHVPFWNLVMHRPLKLRQNI